MVNFTCRLYCQQSPIIKTLAPYASVQTHQLTISIATKMLSENKNEENHCGLSTSSPMAHSLELACVYRIKVLTLAASFSIPILINNTVVSFGIALFCI